MLRCGTNRALCGVTTASSLRTGLYRPVRSIAFTAAVNTNHDWLRPRDDFHARHLGPSASEIESMLATIKADSLEDLVERTVPKSIFLPEATDKDYEGLGNSLTESELLEKLQTMAKKNKVFRSYIGMGYYGTLTPSVIKRNILENPAWYTPYTPYQAEMAQGRLTSLCTYQTMVADLTGLPLSNCSLLDEAIAAGEAAMMSFAITQKRKTDTFFVDETAHPQTIEVLKTRAERAGHKVVVGNVHDIDFSDKKLAGFLFQYPNTTGAVVDHSDIVKTANDAGVVSVCSSDLLALAMLKPPGEFGCDVAIGSAQRFGVPLGTGGPHAAFMSCKNEYLRKMPGRIVGLTKDSLGKPAFRLALQTREQHIKREKATSNICTSQALLANMAAMFAVYHGPQGVKDIAQHVHSKAVALAQVAESAGHTLQHESYFDTIAVSLNGVTADELLAKARDDYQINLRKIDASTISISLDETVTRQDLEDLAAILSVDGKDRSDILQNAPTKNALGGLERTSEILTHELFNKYHTESEMMRYIKRLESKDVSLVHSMMPLGSCTMKLNSATEMMPVSWKEFGGIHPFVPSDQIEGTVEMLRELVEMLKAISGYDAVSLQPNSGAQGEYAGMLAIMDYLKAKGEENRNICLIPKSAHGTNPASASLAGMKIVLIENDSHGAINMDDLRKKIGKHRDNLAAIMITYPSTYGLFDEEVKEVCELIHDAGGQVYLDGANMNAQMMLCKPGEFGADVSHFNLHKTFCIPHGGGGPGMGPIGVKAHLAPHLPRHSLTAPGVMDVEPEGGHVSAAAFGSVSILTISWAYIAMMGVSGLRSSSSIAILNANYMAAKLKDHYKVAFAGSGGFSAHEFIIDVSAFQKSAGVSCTDMAKRLMDFGFHAPTMAWPLPNSLMIEPTESESKEELDRYIDALITIRNEIQEIADGKYPKDNNVLVNAPHPITTIISDKWDKPYSQTKAAFPLPFLKESKTWPTTNRADDFYGDTHVVCECPPLSEWEES